MIGTIRPWLATAAQAVRSHWLGPGSSTDPAQSEMLFGGPRSTAGLAVSEDSALNYAAVWAATRLISECVSSIPLFLYRRDGKGKSRFEEHRLFRILHDEFNPEMSSMVARETLQAHVLLWGNAYAEIQRDASGRVAALWPITPNRVQPYRDPQLPGRPLRYAVTDEAGRSVTLRPDELLHIPGLGFDGVKGYSVVRRAREAIGLGLGTERFGAAFFGSGSTMAGVIEYPSTLTDTALKNFRDRWNAAHQGVDKAHQVAVLEGGMTWKKTGIAPDDAQFLETRKFQTVEIARWFNLPP